MDEIRVLDRIGELDRERSELYAGAARGGFGEHGLRRLHDLEACIDHEWGRLRSRRAGVIGGWSGLHGGG